MGVSKIFPMRQLILIGFIALLASCRPEAPPAPTQVIFYPASTRVCPDGVRAITSGFEIVGTVQFFGKEGTVPIETVEVVNGSYLITKPALEPTTPEQALSSTMWQGLYVHQTALKGSGTYGFRCLGASSRPDELSLSLSWQESRVFRIIVSEDSSSPSGLKVRSVIP